MQSTDTKTEIIADPKVVAELTQITESIDQLREFSTGRDDFIKWYSTNTGYVPWENVGLDAWDTFRCDKAYFQEPPVVTKMESHDELGYYWSETRNGWMKKMFLSPDDDRNTEVMIRRNANDNFEVTIDWASGLSDFIDMEFSSFQIANAFAMSRIKEFLRESR